MTLQKALRDKIAPVIVERYAKSRGITVAGMLRSEKLKKWYLGVSGIFALFAIFTLFFELRNEPTQRSVWSIVGFGTVAAIMFFIVVPKFNLQDYFWSDSALLEEELGLQDDWGFGEPTTKILVEAKLVEIAGIVIRAEIVMDNTNITYEIRTLIANERLRSKQSFRRLMELATRFTELAGESEYFRRAAEKERAKLST